MQLVDHSTSAGVWRTWLARFGWLCVLTLGGATATDAEQSEPPTGPQRVDFARDIRPILEQHCYDCHGPQLAESGYRLDVKSRALAAADRGDPPIVAGRSDESPLIAFVAGTDPDGTVMPPEDEGRPLSSAEVALLRAWVDGGATWPDALAGDPSTTITTDHWSFQPVRRPTVPASSDWISNPIDAFVLAQLQAHGLQPSPPADRVTWARRVYLDMHGLPPTPEEVDLFLSDKEEGAHQRLVDRLLRSPRYGERWARHWLDVVRFGESHGFETNRERPNAYHYRDYVIEALNNDKPYDAFIREQIAGDALGAEVATGFLVAGPYDQVKSPDKNLVQMQRQDELADIINTTGTAFLGLTLGCARCHHHKFDPVTQQDYYALQAVFAGVQFADRPVPTRDAEPKLQQIDQHQQSLAAARAALDDFRSLAAQQPTDDTLREQLRPSVNPVRNRERFSPLPARFVRFTIRATQGGGEPCLDELEVYASELAGSVENPVQGSSPPARNVALASAGTRASASGTLPGYAIHKLAHVHDGQVGNARSWISNSKGSGWVQLEFAETFTIEEIRWGRDREQQYTDRLATDYSIEVAVEPDEWQEVASSADRQPFVSPDDPHTFIAQLPPGEATEARRTVQRIAEHEQAIQQLRSSLPLAFAGTFQEPGKTYRLYRGDHLSPREEVGPDALEVLGSLGLTKETAEQERRIALASWIADPDNPLTARVIVNRIWHHHFGQGLVATPGDFGANGAEPTHPELLDWLADEFVRQGWSLKKLHRWILTSSTYRQDSRPRTEAEKIDAGSQWLWRFPPRRLEAEAIRDAVLYVSGSLQLTGGGPGFEGFRVLRENVYHYLPKEAFGPAEWRRMIYMTKIRMEQDPVFGAFDCPDGGQIVSSRSRSTTPLQALNLLNSRFMMEQASLLAERLQGEAEETAADPVDRAFRLLFSRPPAAEERVRSLALIDQHGLPALCRALLNANEFLFIP